MKSRTGKECKKTSCKNFQYYSNWYRNLGRDALLECMNCRNSHVSQYKRIESKEGVL